MVQVGWGESSMIEAERLLLGEALGDPANQRFVLLSDRFSSSVYTVRSCSKHEFILVLRMLWYISDIYAHTRTHTNKTMSFCLWNVKWQNCH